MWAVSVPPHVSWSGRKSSFRSRPLKSTAWVSPCSSRCGTWMNCTPATASRPSGLNTSMSRRSSTSCTAGLAISGVPWRPMTSVPNWPKPSTWPRCRWVTATTSGMTGLSPPSASAQVHSWCARDLVASIRRFRPSSNSTPSATGVRFRRGSAWAKQQKRQPHPAWGKPPS